MDLSDGNYVLEPAIIIADDHPLFRGALQHAISDLMPECKFLTAGNLDELRTLLCEPDVADLLLLDLAMPGTSGFSGLITVRAEFPAIPAVVVSATEDPATIKRCLDFGASGFIPKSSSTEEIVSGVKAVLAGEIWIPERTDIDVVADNEIDELLARFQSLTPQQTRVLSMLGEGLLNKQIAYELDVSEATIKAHVSAVLLKLGVDSRTQAVIIMNKLGADTILQVNEAG